MTGTNEDRTTRRAALWASAVAVPVAALTALLFVSKATPADEPAAPPPGPGSTAPVTMAAPRLAERETLACRALLSRLPATVRDLSRRPVTAGPEQNAAYGDPAITVACGVPKPTVPKTADLLIMDNVCWYPTDGPDGTVFTTLDREAVVQVVVPIRYENRGQWANEFSAAVAGSIRSAPSGLTGCGD
jgi:hypothetical protein